MSVFIAFTRAMIESTEKASSYTARDDVVIGGAVRFAPDSGVPVLFVLWVILIFVDFFGKDVR